MGARKEVIMANMGRTKKFVRYNEGAQLYNTGVCKFRQLVHEAGAVYKVDRIALVNTEKFEKYLEDFAKARM